MRLSKSIYYGFFAEESFPYLGDILIMTDDGSFTTIDRISEAEFHDIYGMPKEAYLDMLGQAVLEEKIYGSG